MTNNCSISLILIFVGAIVVAITDWGSPASIATLAITSATALVLVIKWVRNKCLNKRPFKSTYALVDATKQLSDDQIKQGDTHHGIQNWNSTNKKMKFHQQNINYSIYLQLKPRVSCSLNDVDLRFIKEDGTEPEVVLLQDINPQSQMISKPSARRGRGLAIYYDPAMHAMTGGKAIDYLATFKIHGAWKGKLSLQLGIVGKPVCYIRINCEVAEGDVDIR